MPVAVANGVCLAALAARPLAEQFATLGAAAADALAATPLPATWERSPGVHRSTNLPTLDTATWGFEVDDQGVTYADGRTGLLLADGRVPGQARSVTRLAPDAAYYAWWPAYALFCETERACIRPGSIADGVAVGYTVSTAVQVAYDADTNVGHWHAVSLGFTPMAGESWLAAALRSQPERFADADRVHVALLVVRLERWYRAEQENRARGGQLVTADQRHTMAERERETARKAAQLARPTGASRRARVNRA